MSEFKYEKYKNKYLKLKKNINFNLKAVLENNENIKKNFGVLLYEYLKKFNIKYYFGVPSDLNMPLFDSLKKCDDLEDNKISFIASRNELNASYIAEGYARNNFFSLCIVGGMVGSLSASNGLGNSISEKNPILMIGGGNNNNDEMEGKLSHHTLFKGINDQTKIYKIMEELVGYENCFKLDSLENSSIFNINKNIINSIINFNSIYLLLPANLQNKNIISEKCIQECLTIIIKKYENMKNDILIKYNFIKLIKSNINIQTIQSPVILIGSAHKHLIKLGINLIDDSFYEYIKKINGKLYFTIDAKGLLDEKNDCVKGCYWGGVTTNNILEEFEKASNNKSLIYLGVILSDYNTTGYTSLFKPTFSIDCENIHTNSRQITLNNYDIKNEANEITMSIVKGIQDLIDLDNKDIDMVVETGSSWYIASNLIISKGYGFNISMRYGSIGWGFPASIGYSLSVPNRKTICLSGDGAFYCVMQELSTAAILGKNKQINLILIIINNNKYQVENALDKQIYNNLPLIDLVNVSKSYGCDEKNVKKCSINNFANVLKNIYLMEKDFYVIILEVPDDLIDTKIKNWAKLVSDYTTKYSGNGTFEK